MTRFISILAAIAAMSTAPRNDLPHPYRTERDWGQLPPGVAWAGGVVRRQMLERHVRK